MTQQSKDSIGSILAPVKDIIIVLGALFATIAGIWYIVLWFTGGLTPKIQLDQDAFRAQLSSIQATQEKNAAASAGWNDRIMARLDALPRPSDYTNQESHLSHIDLAMQAAYDRVTQIEIAASKLAGRFESMISDSADRANKPQLGRAVR